MNASTRIDVNYVSVSGPQNAVTINAGSATAYTPVNYNISKAQNLTPEAPCDYASILKFSGAQGVTMTNLLVSQGAENTVDINNEAANIKLVGDFGYTNINRATCGEYSFDQAITIKGGSHDITITGTLHNKGAVELGNWSDQSTSKCYNVILDLRSTDGSKIDVILGRVDTKTVTLLGDCQINKWESFKLSTYWWAKSLIRNILRIPVGTKGPNWI
jgi:hypothetical protein